ncbi:Sporulation initiation inhibitor protein soj [Anaerohalosphaera lusitana]|uniref:Sporulation initiation inhibitor protein soj n=1 Tax=Anaerohalosphaera lusitana TaxID=1936003 RepID=A0A1U9NGZ3_9BACT|nr:AAA family ATPase [Anaerohalosphaera lusitana]AQT67028.1 Sporulation initiation inhibitor protein soj [Anaerohalosphaera lusitana]
MRTIAVLNQKGGVGKTTTVANTAGALAERGYRVMVIDLDPQAHLTIHLGVDAESDGSGAYDVLCNSANIKEELLHVRENLWLLGANIDLVGAENELVSVVGREIILREALKEVSEFFDYLIIDCPPSLGLLSLNALSAVGEVFIPIQPHFLALQGFGKLMQTVTLVGSRINPSLKISAILLCMYDSRTTLSSDVKSDIEQFLENARGTDQPWADAEIVPIHIRRNIKLAEAPSFGKTIFEYEPACNGASDYQAVAEYLIGGNGDGQTQAETEVAEQSDEDDSSPEAVTEPEPRSVQEAREAAQTASEQTPDPDETAAFEYGADDMSDYERGDLDTNSDEQDLQNRRAMGE